MGTLGFGLIGCGAVAEVHADALSRVVGARLVGVMAPRLEKARAFAEKHRVDFATDSLDALLARPDLDAVCITTPSGAHLEPALAAIKAGKHLVVEKPLEITVDRVDQMLHAAREGQRQLAAIFQARFGAGARTLKAAIDAERFGRLVLCSAYVKWHRTAEYYRVNWRGTQALDGGGALMNQGIHAVDLLQWLVGMPEEVFAWTTRCVHTDIEVEDTACAALRFPNGARGVIEASTAVFPGFSRRIEICGEKGSAILEDDRITAWQFRETRPEDAAILAHDGASFGSGAVAPNQISSHGHQLQLQDFVDALKEGRSPFIHGNEARNAVAMVCALYASARSGHPVRI